MDELWRHKFDTYLMVKLCDVIMLQWVISGDHMNFFLEHFFTKIMNLMSDFRLLQPENLAKIWIEKSENLLKGQICGPIVSDRRYAGPNL